MIEKLRIHIAPVGFDVDRITLPLIEMRADKVYLLIQEPDGAGAKLYVKEIIKILKKSNIRDIKECPIQIFDIYKTLNEIRKIIEREKNNSIFINVSTGSKICSMAGLMASIICKEDSNFIKTYYVIPTSYHYGGNPSKKLNPQTKGMKSILSLPTYRAHLPNKKLIEVLNFIYTKQEVTKKQIVSFLYPETMARDFDRKELSKIYMKVNRKYINELVGEWNFIKVEGMGKSSLIRLTQNGQDMIKFLKD